MADLSTVDYPLVGPPTISFATFDAVLRNAGSPAAGEASAMWSAATRYGIDPGVLLGVFQHESSFGKAGIAVGRHNGFGSRFYAGMGHGAVNVGGWASFPTWADGAAYTAALLSSSMYAGNPTYSTVRKFPYRYAPSSDGNSPAAYGSALVAAITSWRGGTTTGSVPATAAPTATQVSAPTPSSPWNGKTFADLLGLPPATALSLDLLHQIQDKARAENAAGRMSDAALSALVSTVGSLEVGVAHGGTAWHLGDFHITDSGAASSVPDLAAVVAGIPEQFAAIAGHLALLVAFVALAGTGVYLVARSES